MIKLTHEDSEQEILRKLTEGNIGVSMMLNLPVVTVTDSSEIFWLQQMKNLETMARILSLTLMSDKVRQENKHVVVQLLATGIVLMWITSSDEISVPEIMEMAVIGTA